MELKKNIKLSSQILIVLALMIISTTLVSASSTFVLSVATEDVEQSTLANPYYITSTITVISYTPDRTQTNYGPVSRFVPITDPRDNYYAFVDFWPIPTDSIVRFESSAEGYETGFSETYISSKLSNAYESLQKKFSHSENGFKTTCSMSEHSGFPYYMCSVIDDYGTSGRFYYYRPENPATGEIYDLVYVTNKLRKDKEDEPPVEPPVEPPIICTDADGDGYSPEGGYCGPIDCDDNDPDVYPGAPESCNGKDNNCNGLIDGVNAEGDVCPATYPLKSIDVSLSPKIALDMDNLVCSINIENINSYTGKDDLTIFYNIVTTAGFNVIGDFVCKDGECEQEIIINNIFTEANSELTCSAWFVYNSIQYDESASIFINQNPINEKTQRTERHDIDFDRMRFVEGDRTRPGGSLEFQIALSNRGKPISNMRVNLVLLGLDNGERYVLGPFSLDNEDNKFGRFNINIPNDASPGEYHARISISDGEYRMVRHRIFFIEEK